ncbi:MAG: glycosyltransferase family 2 protein [bacterium]
MVLSVVIVSYNVRELLLNCLDSIYRNPPPNDFEVFVVDNASSDGSAEAVRSAFPEVKLIENRENAGFPKANNQGIANSKGKYILLLNPDTVVLDGALAKMIDFMEAHPECGILGPRILNPDMTWQRSCFTRLSLLSVLFNVLRLPRLFPQSPFFSFHFYGGWRGDSTREVDSVTGACLLIRREALNQIGPMDESLFWTEDNDLCLRAKNSGWRVFFLHTAEVIHYIGESSKKNVYIKLTRQYLSKVQFFRKHNGRGSVALLKIVLAAEILAKIAVRAVGLILNRPPDCRIRLKAYFIVLKEFVMGEG